MSREGTPVSLEPRLMMCSSAEPAATKFAGEAIFPDHSRASPTTAAAMREPVQTAWRFMLTAAGHASAQVRFVDYSAQACPLPGAATSPWCVRPCHACRQQRKQAVSPPRSVWRPTVCREGRRHC